MKAQKPAEGILINRDYGDAKNYTVTCECGDSDHSHHIWVESEDTGVTVHTHTEQTTDYWSQKLETRYDINNEIYQNIHWFFVGLFNDWYRRFKLVWQVLTKGHIKYQATIIMTEQQALNYAETLKSAVADVKEFKKQRQSKKENVEAVRAASEQDCV
jgi:hypothetical protein